MTNMDISKKATRAAGQNIKERDFWLTALSGEWVRGGFPYDRLERDEAHRFETLSVCLEGTGFAHLMRLSNGSEQRLFMILVSMLQLLLYKYTGHRDVVVGAPILTQDVEGDFINTVLPLRNRMDPNMSFKELLLQVRKTIVDATEHQNYPMDALLHKLKLKMNDGFPLFDAAVLLENIHDRNYIKHIAVNMVFSFRQRDGAVDLLLDYNPSFYSGAAAAGIGRHYRYLTEGLTACMDVPVWEIGILSEAEKKQILLDFNDTGGDYPEGKTIHQLFAEQAEKTPHNIALHMAGCADMTYERLNREADCLADRLRGLGVGPDVIVGLMIDRSMEMIVAVLGILKADGAYLPIDMNYPEERKEYMLSDSGTEIVIRDGNDPFDIVTRSSATGPATEPTTGKNNGAENLVYLVYTSGSTGKPKGVMLEHKHVVNLIHYGYVSTNLDFSRILQFHTIGFDASFHEIFCALLCGGTLYLIDEETRADIPALFEVVRENEIVTLFLPMSYLRMIFNDESYVRLIPDCVRHIQIAGEQVVVKGRFRRWLREKHVYLHNHYGPAETHVVTALTLDPDGEIPELPSIGKPILNSTIYILDKDQQVLPVGVPGELYIGGIQVGRGYLHKPQLTAEKFVVLPAAVVAAAVPAVEKSASLDYRFGDGPVYRTGDLARWLPDGNVQFLGRIDKQVKVRGFRVEPGEIESHLMDLAYVKEASVIDRTDEKGDKFLCAYVVASVEIDAAALRKILGKVLPDYMIPAYFIQLSEIPLTPNGKVDRDTLQAIEISVGTGAYAPPRDELEEKLCDLWADILGLDKERIGIDDNFFQLGGHSLKATILISRVHKGFNVRISLGQIFNRPDIRGLAEFIKSARPETFVALVPAEPRQYYPLSSSQKRMYILNQLSNQSTNYNMPAALLVEGELDAALLESVFQKIAFRQEGLRTRFVVVDGEPVQEIVDVVLKVSLIDASAYSEFREEPAAKFLTDFVRPFDLDQAPLLRVGLVKLAPDKHLLMVDMHHIIGDGVSLGILVREFTHLYHGNESAPLRIQYKDYACGQDAMQRQETYWLRQLEGEVPVLNLPLDFPRPAMMSFEGRRLDFEITAEPYAKLKELAGNYEVTLYMVLLAVYNVVLNKYTGNHTILVGSAVAGRIHPDLADIIGVFLNTLVMKNTIKENQDFADFLKSVGQTALDAYDHQEYPLETLVEKLAFKRDYSRNPLFDTVFNFNNTEIPDVTLRNLRMTPCPLESNAVKFDLKINAEEKADGLRFNLDYCTKLFKQETMESFIENFKQVVNKVTENPTVKISQISLLSETTSNEIIDDFSEDLHYDF